ncbi:2Fe-2S iron-sulfur cluster-binding protein, partial [Salmonella enterica subsp. enterica serovar Kentucky]|nr:2Fe-2S iron-sulfur cluster-binding protein [Salmonella enterica subsp. enterica serovar Kentucky]
IIKIFPSNIEFSGREDESILDAALSAGIHLEHSCKAGDCGICGQRLGVAQQNHANRQVLSQLTELLGVGNNRQAVSDFIRQQYGQ